MSTAKSFRFVPLLLIHTTALCIAADVPHSPTAASRPSAEAALKRLEEGNQRFAAGNAKHAHQDPARRHETVTDGQHPFAAILACADSRVPPELVFDQGLGDLFVVRVAGNICGRDECGSLEYAVEHLQTPLLIVIGHTRCGAVTAAVEHVQEHGSIPALLQRIEPAVKSAEGTQPDSSKSALIAVAVRENVFASMDALITHSAILREAIRNGSTQLIGAVYDLDSGRVQWLGPHPRQAELVSRSTQDGWAPGQ